MNGATMGLGGLVTLPGILLVAAACSTAAAPATPTTEPAAPPSPTSLTIANEGGSREGHTPTAFAGMGTGLFAGDNLNARFPEGVGVQIYLTFPLLPDLDAGEASIISDALTISGTPFADLGALVVEPVEYESFGPELFDDTAIGPSTVCVVTYGTAIACDVSEALDVAVAAGKVEAQFRLRFEEPADNDGRQDLAMFFRTDSNTNEPGIFELVIGTGT
jgi:hypothetical protein